MADIADEDIDLLDFFSSSNDVDETSTSNRQTTIAHPVREAKEGRRAAAVTPFPHDNPTPSPAQRQHPQRSVSSKQQQHQQQHSVAPPDESRTHQHGQRASSHAPAAARGSKVAPPRPVADFTEAFSGLRVRNRLLSADDMRLRMKGRKVHRLANLKTVPARVLESQDPSDAWAALGVLVSKSPRRQAANGGSYCIWTLSDLASKDNDVSLFLFQEALGSHWTVCEGTLLAVLSAKALPPKEGSDKLAFSVDAPWQISRVGMAMDYGLCKGKRKDGRPCTMPVNKSEGGGYCEFHVVAAFNRAQRQNPLHNKSNGSGSGNGGSSNSGSSNKGSGSNLRAMIHAQALAGRHNQTPFSGGRATPSTVAPVGRTAPAAQRNGAPAPSLSGILGAGSRRREDAGFVRFGVNGERIAGPPSTNAKPLRPSAARMAGRTTVLSTRPSSSPGGNAKSPHGRGTRKNDAREAGGRSGAKDSTACVDGGEKEDLLQLPWEYGRQKDSGDSMSSRSGGGAIATHQARVAVGDNGEGPGLKRKRVTTLVAEGSGGRGRVGGANETSSSGEDQGSLAARAPAKAHPAGHKDGSVVVPADSSVFLTMPQRCGVRADGSRTKEGEKRINEIQIKAKQRMLKEKADAEGVLLRVQDPNVATAATSKRSILGTGRQGGRAGVKSANALLGVGKGTSAHGRRSDPLTKKVKTMSTVEKELLLRRVSKYAGLAEEERAEEADKSMKRLEQREAMADKAEEVTKMAVTVYHCAECKMRRNHFSKRCRDLGHQQKGVKATLRFFECTNCRKRRSCTDRVPQTGCEGCGRHNEWKRCGARPGRGPAEGARDKRFVAAVSEWTDQRDLSLAAPDFR